MIIHLKRWFWPANSVQNTHLQIKIYNNTVLSILAFFSLTLLISHKNGKIMGQKFNNIERKKTLSYLRKGGIGRMAFLLQAAPDDPCMPMTHIKFLMRKVILYFFPQFTFSFSSPHWLILVLYYALFVQWSMFPLTRIFIPSECKCCL